MICPRHSLATGPDGRCALCRRDKRVLEETNVRHDDRRVHRRIRVFIAVVALVATYAILMALLDTTPTPEAAPSTPKNTAPVRSL